MAVSQNSSRRFRRKVRCLVASGRGTVFPHDRDERELRHDKNKGGDRERAYELRVVRDRMA